MKRSLIVAILALLIGLAVLSYTITDSGLEPSFPLLLGALLVADGVIRLVLMRLPDQAEQDPGPA